MARIVWLASYPKSGNTWMRALLTNYRRDTDEPADVNRLEGGPSAGARVWFDEWAGVEASALPAEVVERLRSGVYRCLAREAEDILFMKVHDAWRCSDRGEPVFPADVTAGVVYIVRNPLDVAVSYAGHYGIDVAEAVERMCDPEHTLAGSKRSLSEQLPQPTRDWKRHVTSWLDESGLAVHLVRYEDLRVDPEGVFAGVVRFAGLPFDPERIAKAVRFSQFAELQRQEREAGFRERSAGASVPFFRRGESGSWRDELAPALAARLIDAHGEMMLRMGYSDDP